MRLKASLISWNRSRYGFSITNLARSGTLIAGIISQARLASKSLFSSYDFDVNFWLAGQFQIITFNRLPGAFVKGRFDRFTACLVAEPCLDHR